jgi:hypothetical protein
MRRSYANPSRGTPICNSLVIELTRTKMPSAAGFYVSRANESCEQDRRARPAVASGQSNHR